MDEINTGVKGTNKPFAVSIVAIVSKKTDSMRSSSLAQGGAKRR